MAKQNVIQFDAVALALRELRQEFLAVNKETHDAALAIRASIPPAYDDSELRELIKNLPQYDDSELREAVKTLPQYDDSEIREGLSTLAKAIERDLFELKETIPAQYDDSKLKERLEQLLGRIEHLEQAGEHVSQQLEEQVETLVEQIIETGENADKRLLSLKEEIERYAKVESVAEVKQSVIELQQQLEAKATASSDELDAIKQSVGELAAAVSERKEAAEGAGRLHEELEVRLSGALGELRDDLVRGMAETRTRTASLEDALENASEVHDSEINRLDGAVKSALGQSRDAFDNLAAIINEQAKSLNNHSVLIEGLDRTSAQLDGEIRAARQDIDKAVEQQKQHTNQRVNALHSELSGALDVLGETLDATIERRDAQQALAIDALGEKLGEAFDATIQQRDTQQSELADSFSKRLTALQAAIQRTESEAATITKSFESERDSHKGKIDALADALNAHKREFSSVAEANKKEISTLADARTEQNAVVESKVVEAFDRLHALELGHDNLLHKSNTSFVELEKSLAHVESKFADYATNAELAKALQRQQEDIAKSAETIEESISELEVALGNKDTEREAEIKRRIEDLLVRTQAVAVQSEQSIDALRDSIEADKERLISGIETVDKALVRFSKEFREELAAESAKLSVEVKSLESRLQVKIDTTQVSVGKVSDSLEKTGESIDQLFSAIDETQETFEERIKPIENWQEAADGALVDLRAADDEIRTMVVLQKDELLKAFESELTEKIKSLPAPQPIEFKKDFFESEIQKAVAEAKQRFEDIANELSKKTTGPRGPEGFMRPARTFVKGDPYLANELVRHNGGLWQSKIETGEEPSTDSDAWLLLSDGVSNIGIDAASAFKKSVQIELASGQTKAFDLELPLPTDRGTFSRSGEYKLGDTVMWKNVRWVAQKDNPGEPGIGDGWYVTAQRGPKGEKGETGEPGKTGLRGLKGGKGEKGDTPEMPSVDEIAKTVLELIDARDELVMRRFVGQWSYGMELHKGDLVSFGGGLYLAKRPHKSTESSDRDTVNMVTVIPTKVGIAA